MRDFLSVIALSGAIFLFWMPASAQSPQGRDLESVIEQMAEEGVSEEAIEDYLQQLLPEEGRINLNTASRESLERCGLFTRFQIASLLEYRADYGALLSVQELAMVDGFGAETVARLAPFISLKGDDADAGVRLQARSRYRYKSTVAGLHQYNRVLFEKGGLKAGVLAESDAGEIALVDYIGAYVGYQKGRWNILAGDYSACLGQGLAVWNAFCFTGATAPASVMRRPRGIEPYKSAEESMALRGVALEYRLQGGFQAAVFVSAAGVDARVEEEGYKSLPATGYHRTIAEKAAKNAMREYLAGGHITRRGEWFEAGITAVAYSFSEHNARQRQPYNQFQMYDGWMGNLSADAVVGIGHWRLFAEVAADAKCHLAAVAGAVLSASYNFEASASVRYYDKAYIAPHAGAYSTISSVSNQAGAVFSLLWRPLRGMTVTSFSEAVYYPWQRYRIPEPSWAVYEKARAEYSAGGWTLSLQDNYVWQSHIRRHKHSIKGVSKWEGGRWKASVRAGAVVFRGPLAGVSASGSSGVATSVSVAREFGRRRHSVTASVSFYDAADYDSRVYLYESDLPGSFSAQYYFGKGIAARCLVKIKPCPKVVLSCVAVVSAAPEVRLQADYNF